MTPMTPIAPNPQLEQSPKNPMSDKASCSNIQLEEDNPTNDADTDAAENRQDETDLLKLDMPAPLLALCQYVETKLKLAN
ncbi:hypothetical protein L3X38_003676 [Prunus dulcis]|uniref:Uncharacterized protein n=1 Tax=Prunus dulcis TaxID=3755 RepID=A0AAD4ZMI1_PRUDU|nr:hypothetical protein L3X38_003676 [Prunus dulcis]